MRETATPDPAAPAPSVAAPRDYTQLLVFGAGGALLIWLSLKARDVVEQKQGESSYMSLVRDAANAANLPPAILGGTVFKESNWSNAPNSCARSQGYPCILGGCNEKEVTVGLAQMRPSVAREHGYSGPDTGLCDPATNLMVAARIMKALYTKYNGDAAKAYAAYNAGPGATDRAIAQGGENWIDYIPSSTRTSYVPKALAAAQEYQTGALAGVAPARKLSLFRISRQAV